MCVRYEHFDMPANIRSAASFALPSGQRRVVGQYEVEVGDVDVRLVPVDQRDLMRGYADVARARWEPAPASADVTRYRARCTSRRDWDPSRSINA